MSGQSNPLVGWRRIPDLPVPYLAWNQGSIVANISGNYRTKPLVANFLGNWKMRGMIRK